MTQEEKQILLQDLCARLPYGVKVYAGEDLAMTLKQIDYKGFCESWENEDFKCHSRWMLPYLRPMSSMTEEEKKELKKLFDAEEVTSDSICFLEGGTLEEYVSQVGYSFCAELIDWLNAHHFDYRGLIEKGLAIEVTEDNN